MAMSRNAIVIARRICSTCRPSVIGSCQPTIITLRNATTNTEVDKQAIPKPPIATTKVLETIRERRIPVESYSLSRGLALNRFEKVKIFD